MAEPCDTGRTKRPVRYRLTHRGGQVVYVHRVAYEAAYGPVPEGMFVLHHCDVPACAEPTHLYAGTNRRNMQDASDRGRLERSSATRERLRQASTGKLHSAETRAKISAAKRGRPRRRVPA